MIFFLKPSPVHSAHIGDEVEVHYRWHPYFQQRVNVRRAEKRANGLFLKVLGPVGTVVSIPGWMIDPIVCAGMSLGQPRVDLEALSDMKRLVTRAAVVPHSSGENGIAWEDVDETVQCTRADHRRANESDVRAPQAGRVKRSRAGEGQVDACADVDAGSRSGRRGGRR